MLQIDVKERPARFLNILAVTLATVGLMATATGCDTLYETPNDNWGYFDDWDPGIEGDLLKTGDGAIAGDFGDSDLQEPTDGTVTAWHASGMWGMEVSTVEVRATASDGWISMALVEVYGGLAEGGLEPGTTRRFNIEDDTPGLFVVVTGCTGFNSDDWTNDDLAQSVTLSVEPDVDDQGMRTVHFEAEFEQDWLSPNYSPTTTTLSGSFQVRPALPLY